MENESENYKNEIRPNLLSQDYGEGPSDESTSTGGLVNDEKTSSDQSGGMGTQNFFASDDADYEETEEDYDS